MSFINKDNTQAKEQSQRKICRMQRFFSSFLEEQKREMRCLFFANE
jgi:hypothetical protein